MKKRSTSANFVRTTYAAGHRPRDDVALRLSRYGASLTGDRIVQRAAHNRVHLAFTGYRYVGQAAPREFIFGFSGMTERALREGVKTLAR
jgi:DNA-binding transcriptional MocR family regulator